jgi:5-methylcytosine-specific restriction enzyme A
MSVCSMKLSDSRTKRWVLRSRMQLSQHPLCKRCFEKGLIVPATVADHVIPHRGDQHLFWFGELQSLCAPCHNGWKQAMEKTGTYIEIGPDGWPKT